MTGWPLSVRVRLVLWLGLGVLMAGYGWRDARRPANERAQWLKLVPRQGVYGPVYVSALVSDTRAQPGQHSGAIFLSSGTGIPGGVFVSVPTMRWTSADSPQLGTLSETLLARDLAGTVSPSPAVRFEMAELIALARGATAEGVSTSVKRFRLADARPWIVPRWARGGRWASYVTVWLVVGAWLWRIGRS